MINLDTYLIAGKTVRRYYRKGHYLNRLLHIRAIIDNEYVVYRVWSTRNRYWFYELNHINYFEILNKNGHLYRRYQKVIER